MFFKAFNVNVLRNFESSQHFLNGSVVEDIEKYREFQASMETFSILSSF